LAAVESHVLLVADMDSSEELQVVDIEREINGACDESVATAVAVDHLDEVEDDHFEDALDSLSLDSSEIEDEDRIVTEDCETDAFSQPCCNLQNINDDVLHDAFADTDAEERSLNEPEAVAGETQEPASGDSLVIDEEVLREREARLTDEQKQVLKIVL